MKRKKTTSRKRMPFTIPSVTISMTLMTKMKNSTSPTPKKTSSTKSSPKATRLQLPTVSIRRKPEPSLLRQIETVKMTVAGGAAMAVVMVAVEIASAAETATTVLKTPAEQAT